MIGRMIKTDTMPIAAAMSSTFSQAGSLATIRPAVRLWRTKLGCIAAVPCFEPVDHAERREGKDQEHRRHRRRFRILVSVELGDDEDRRDFRFVRQVAND